jgi:Ca2+-binding EF-hand superfamily protein
MAKLLAPAKSAMASTTKKAHGAPKIELTDEQKQDIREAFDLFDTDGTGASPRGRAAPASLAAFPSHCYCHCLCPSL